MKQDHSRRLTPWMLAISIGALFGLAACTAVVVPATAPALQPVTRVAEQSNAPQNLPDCSRGITPAQTEGPYYKSNTPEDAYFFKSGMTGTKIVLTGYVLTRDCKPIAGAWLDFWQANDKGEYDNRTYTLRGHQFADARGRYTLETILPGLYPGRTRHIHAKVQAPNQPVLTTQLYFPEEPHNSGDSTYDPKLLVTWQNTPDGRIARYDFVLNVN